MYECETDHAGLLGQYAQNFVSEVHANVPQPKSFPLFSPKHTSTQKHLFSDSAYLAISNIRLMITYITNCRAGIYPVILKHFAVRPLLQNCSACSCVAVFSSLSENLA